jgi:hypothetical protein
MLAPGEAVLNRHQQAVVEGLLGNGFLDKLFSKVNRPHYMARGGVARLARGGMVAAANRLDHAHFPYVWGGGHQGTPAPFGPMDCSGAVSYVLQQGGVSVPTMTSGQLMRAGKPGAGQVTVYANPEHTLMRIGGRFFGTSQTNPAGGAGWMPDPGAGYLSRFVQRHFEGGAGFAVPKIPRVLTRLPGGVGALAQRALDVARSGAQGVAQRAWASMGVGTGNENNPGIGGMSKAQLRKLWIQANGGLGNPNLMAAIALAESGGRAGAANGPYHGLWQVGPGGSFNPLTNARQAGQKLRTQGLGRGRRTRTAPTGSSSTGAAASRGSPMVAAGARRPAAGHRQRAGPAGSVHVVQGFSLKSARRRAGHRVKSYDETQSHVETLRKAYALEERKYNRIDESTYLHEQADGSVTVDEQALKRKMRPLSGMLLLAAQIRDGLARARKIARSVVAAERAIIKRLSGSLKHAKKKDRSGILAQLRGARGDLAEWAAPPTISSSTSPTPSSTCSTSARSTGSSSERPARPPTRPTATPDSGTDSGADGRSDGDRRPGTPARRRRDPPCRHRGGGAVRVHRQRRHRQRGSERVRCRDQRADDRPEHQHARARHRRAVPGGRQRRRHRHRLPGDADLPARDGRSLMADIRRLVTLSTGGRPVTVLDFEASSTYYAERDSFTYEPGESNTQSSREPGRYGGSLVVDEAQANGTVRWRAQIKGTTGDQVAQRTEALIAAINNDAPDQLLQWRPDGASYNNFFRIAGPARWTPQYRWVLFHDAQAMVVEIAIPVRPLVLWDPLRIADDFAGAPPRTSATTRSTRAPGRSPSASAVSSRHRRRSSGCITPAAATSTRTCKPPCPSRPGRPGRSTTRSRSSASGRPRASTCRSRRPRSAPGSRR